MSNLSQLNLLNQGVAAWNKWRNEHPDIEIDLKHAQLWGRDLRGVNLCGADLRLAHFSWSNLRAANLSKADLSQAYLHQAQLIDVNLSKAKLKMTIATEANFDGADLGETCLECANLGGAKLNNTNLSKGDLTFATLVQTELNGADLTGCSVYGISAWDVQLDYAQQLDLKITHSDQPMVTVDNLKVAQIMYLLLDNRDIRDVLKTITSKVVLILGRFTDERKKVLDELRDELRKRNLLPLIFDFDPTRNRDLIEMISVLAPMARFIIADITDARAVREELERIAPKLPSIPIQLLLQKSADLYITIESIMRLDWVLDIYPYQDTNDLLASLTKIIDAAEQKAEEIAQKLEEVRYKIRLHNERAQLF